MPCQNREPLFFQDFSRKFKYNFEALLSGLTPFIFSLSFPSNASI